MCWKVDKWVLKILNAKESIRISRFSPKKQECFDWNKCKIRVETIPCRAECWHTNLTMKNKWSSFGVTHTFTYYISNLIFIVIFIVHAEIYHLSMNQPDIYDKLGLAWPCCESSIEIAFLPNHLFKQSFIFESMVNRTPFSMYTK